MLQTYCPEQGAASHGPLVLAHGGVGYGPNGNAGMLLAKTLVHSDRADRFIILAGAKSGESIGGGAPSCSPRLAGLPSVNYPALTTDPRAPDRLLVGTERCGLWEVNDVGALFRSAMPGGQIASQQRFSQIVGTRGELAEAYIADIAFVRGGVIFALDKRNWDNPSLYRIREFDNGAEPGNQSYQVEEVAGVHANNGVSAWSWGNRDLVVVPGRPQVDPENQNVVAPTQVLLSVDDGESFVSALNESEALALRQSQLPWFDPALSGIGMPLTFCCTHSVPHLCEPQPHLCIWRVFLTGIPTHSENATL